MSATPTLVFLRHGETDWNVEGRLQGQHDVPINAKGREQARVNGEHVTREVPEAAGFDFVASPLCRARETMEIARTAMGLDPTGYRVDDRLKELTFGEWEGYTYRDIERSNPGWIAQREADKWLFQPPGGESYQMLSGRIVGWLETVDRPTFVVSHGGVGRVLRAHLLKLDPLKTVIEDFPHDRVFLWKDGQGRWL
jgi:broad specificity phosphatase PhoE